MKFLINLIVLLSVLNAFAVPPIDKEGREFANPIIYRELGSTPTTPITGKRKVYAKNDGVYQLDSLGAETKVGSGSGGGGINYVSPNGDAENGVGTWAVFNDVITQPQATLGNGTVDEIGDAINISTTLNGREGLYIQYSSSGTVIAGLTNNAFYYLRNVVDSGASFSFQLSTTTTGAIVDLTAEGTGTHTFFPTLQPSNGVGGTATATLTTSATSPIEKTKSYLCTTGAGDNGGGCSLPFSIDREGLGRVQTLSAMLEIPTPANYTSGFLSLFVYDVTNKVIVPYTEASMGIDTSGKIQKPGSGPFQVLAKFAADATSTSYRLIVFQSFYNTWGGLKFDSVKIGMDTSPRGPPVTDWTKYTPTFSGLGAPTNVNFWSRRVGDSLEVHGTFISGTATASQAQIGLGYNGVSGGISSDASKLSSDGTVVGSWALAVVGSYSGYVTALATNQPYVGLGVASSALAGFSFQNGNSITGIAGQYLSFYWKVPILGWSSNVVISSDQSGRRALFRGILTTTQSIASGVETNIPFTSTTDTLGKYVSPNYTIAESDYYELDAGATWDSVTGVAQEIFIYQNAGYVAYGSILGAASSYITARASSGVVWLNAGDVVKATTRQSSGSAKNLIGIVGTFLSIKKAAQGGQTIAMSDQISGSYGAGTTTFPTGGAPTAPLFATKQWDTHNAYNPATGKVCVPAPGKYEFHAHVWISNWTPANANNAIQFDLNKNGAGEYGTAAYPALTTGARNVSLDTTFVFDLVAGDCINADVQNGTGTNLTMINNTGYSYFHWNRLQ